MRRNMDIIGVPGVAAEAELLAAIVLFHERLGLTSADIVIKVCACTPGSLSGAAHCAKVSLIPLCAACGAAGLPSAPVFISACGKTLCNACAPLARCPAGAC